MPRRLLAAAIATGALALAGPVAGASAAAFPPFSLPSFPATGAFPLGAGVGGLNEIGTSAGCAGTNRPSIGGNTGSTSAQTCAAMLVFNGPQIGQLSSVMGPTIIGSVITGQVNVSAGSITQP